MLFNELLEETDYFNPYRSLNNAFSSSGKEVKYRRQPGQKLICQRQIRPIIDFGLASYFALIEHASQLCFCIKILMV